MKITITNALISLMLSVLVLCGLVLMTQRTFGNVTSDLGGPPNAQYVNYTFFATTTPQVTFATSTAAGVSATSTNINAWTDEFGQIDRGYFVIKGAKRVEMRFEHSAATTTSAGVSTYRVQVAMNPSPSEGDWMDFTKLVQATSTQQQLNASLTGATQSTFALDLTNNHFYAVRCIILAASLNDGKANCSAAASY